MELETSGTAPEPDQRGRCQSLRLVAIRLLLPDDLDPVDVVHARSLEPDRLPGAARIEHDDVVSAESDASSWVKIAPVVFATDPASFQSMIIRSRITEPVRKTWSPS